MPPRRHMAWQETSGLSFRAGCPRSLSPASHSEESVVRQFLESGCASQPAPRRVASDEVPAGAESVLVSTKGLPVSALETQDEVGGAGAGFEGKVPASGVRAGPPAGERYGGRSLSRRRRCHLVDGSCGHRHLLLTISVQYPVNLTTTRHSTRRPHAALRPNHAPLPSSHLEATPATAPGRCRTVRSPWA